MAQRKGNAVVDLRKEDFKIFENGVEQEIAYFSDEDQPSTVALMLDMSYSSVFKLEEIQAAAWAFVSQLREDDRVMVISFAKKVQVLCEPTNNRKVLRLAIDVTPRAELHGQRLFVPPSRNDDGLETHLRSELNGQMTEAPYSQYGDRIPGPRAAVSKRVEGGDSRAHQRPRVYG